MVTRRNNESIKDYLKRKCEAQKLYYTRHRTRILAANRNKYLTDPEKRRKKKEYNLKWSQTNRDHLLAYKKSWYLKNKTRLSIKAYQYRKINRETLRAKNKDYKQRNADRIRLKNIQYRLSHAEEIRERNRLYHREKRIETREKKWQVKRVVINHYSGGKNECACCGESIFAIMTIDHINENGTEHRKLLKIHAGHSFYCWLVKNNFPSGYQVLCWNCNVAKEIYGYCPHQTTDP